MGLFMWRSFVPAKLITEGIQKAACCCLRLTVLRKDVCTDVSPTAATLGEEGSYSSAMKNGLYCVVLHSIADHHTHPTIQRPSR